MASHHRLCPRVKPKCFLFLKNPKKATTGSLKTREIYRRMARLIFYGSLFAFKPAFSEKSESNSMDRVLTAWEIRTPLNYTACFWSNLNAYRKRHFNGTLVLLLRGLPHNWSPQRLAEGFRQMVTKLKTNSRRSSEGRIPWAKSKITSLPLLSGFR